MIADNRRLIHFGFFVGPFRLNHWFVLIGTLYVAIAVPAIASIKRRALKNQLISRYAALTRVHVFGNLVAFLLISLHFIGQISRPAVVYPDLGTGLALYIIMILLVSTGFTHRFDLIPQIKAGTRIFVHIAFTFSFYTIIAIHVLHGLGYLWLGYGRLEKSAFVQKTEVTKYILLVEKIFFQNK